jgi:GTP pyrophosphokinase
MKGTFNPRSVDPFGRWLSLDIDADPALPNPRGRAASATPAPVPASAAPAPVPTGTTGDQSAEGFTQRVLAMLPWPTRKHTRFENLVRTHRAIHAKANLPLLHRAHEVAHQLHDGQVRRSGEPYISHPVAVAQILAELGMDTTTLVAALLHDTVEDTTYTLDQLRRDFGDSVTHLVDGVTKLDSVFFGETAEAETIRKMIVAAGRDVRVLLIKVADRLHNMRTLKYKSRASQVRTARATRDVLVPLADRLGIHVVKRELDDLVLATLDPEAYGTIDDYLANRPDRTAFYRRVIAELKDQLRLARVHATVRDRPRHHSSIYADMAASPTGQPYDPPRVMVLVSGPDTDCYAALGAVHGIYRPVPGRFKDFIATPKFNLYQSLHTTVIGPGREPIEVQLRTEQMHRTAEYGIVSHYRWPDPNRDGSRGEQLEWLRRLIDWQSEATDSSDFLTSLRSDLSYGQIQVFTTRGDQLVLPSGATPVDVAYALATTTGDRLIGAYVNGRLAPVTGMLGDGDVVEIITASGDDYPGPSREWLQAAKSAPAQLQINQWFAAREGDDAYDHAVIAKKIAAGRLAVGIALRRWERALADDRPVTMLAQKQGYPDAEALFVAITDGRLSADDVAEQLIATVDHA